MVTNMYLGVRKAWTQNLALLLTSCVILDKLVNPFVPQFLHL